MITIEIYNLLLPELKKALYWCENYNENEDFDIDFIYNKIINEYNLSMKFGFLNPIYSLLDTLCDSVRHNQKVIKDGYTVMDGIEDLKNVINYIENDKIMDLENNLDLKKKLNRLYS